MFFPPGRSEKPWGKAWILYLCSQRLNLGIERMHLGLFAKYTPSWSVSVNAVDKSGRPENCPVDSQIGVDNRNYHYLSRFEIASDKRISQDLSDFPRDNSRPTISSRAHVPLSSCQGTRGYREASVGERARRGLLLLTVTLLPDSRNHSTLRR